VGWGDSTRFNNLTKPILLREVVAGSLEFLGKICRYMQSFLYLVIEFLDELVFGVNAAATPLMRDDLASPTPRSGCCSAFRG
jgi:hypothetical protein